MKKAISLFLCLQALFLFSIVPAFGEPIIIRGKTSTDIRVKSNYRNNPVIPGISSTTGLRSSGEEYTPIMVVLDNAEAAYPHWGVSQADIIFQVPNAGKGATKLLALFADFYPAQAGGVRSARATMLPLAVAWNAALAYAGPPVTKGKYVDINALLKKWKMNGKKAYNLLGNQYQERTEWVEAPHNLACLVGVLHKNLVSKKVKFTERPFLFTDEPLSRGEDASAIVINQYGDVKKGSGNHASYSEFVFDPDTNAYHRYNHSGEYADRDTDEAVTFSNVIVLRTELGWQDGYIYLRKHLVGKGTAEIFQSGKYIQGAWVRKKDTSRLVFTDETGKELKMQRGRSFIIVTNDVTEVAYEP